MSSCYFIVCVAQRAGPGKPAPRQSRNSTAHGAFPCSSCLSLGLPPLRPVLGSASEPRYSTPRRLAGQPEPSASPGPVSLAEYPRSAEEPRAAFPTSLSVPTSLSPASSHCQHRLSTDLSALPPPVASPGARAALPMRLGGCAVPAQSLYREEEGERSREGELGPAVAARLAFCARIGGG